MREPRELVEGKNVAYDSVEVIQLFAVIDVVNAHINELIVIYY